MREESKLRLQEAGIDVDEMLGRFMGNEGMAMKFLLRFPQDPSFQKLREALNRGDGEEAYTAAHTLKGVAGNLSMKLLLEQAAVVTDCLRERDLSAARAGMPLLEERYRRVVSFLNDLDG